MVIRKDSAPLLKAKAAMRAKIDALYDSPHRRMSRQDAQILAKELFGPGGSVSKGGATIPKANRWMVGLIEETETDFKFKVAGWGSSWEEAFECANRNRVEAPSGNDADSAGAGVDGGGDVGTVRGEALSEGGSGGSTLTQEDRTSNASGTAPQDGGEPQRNGDGPPGVETGGGEHHAAGERTGAETYSLWSGSGAERGG